MPVLPARFCRTRAAAAELLTAAQIRLQEAAAADATFHSLAAGVQLLGRTKSLYSIMRLSCCALAGPRSW